MKPKKEAVIRTAILVLALINNALVLFGKSPLPIDNDTLSVAISFIFTTGSALAAWWYNNSFTQPAILADQWLKTFKEEEKKKCEE